MPETELFEIMQTKRRVVLEWIDRRAAAANWFHPEGIVCGRSGRTPIKG